MVERTLGPIALLMLVLCAVLFFTDVTRGKDSPFNVAAHGLAFSLGVWGCIKLAKFR
jgi:hypothetical protein